MTITIRGFIETSLIDWDGLVSAVVFLGDCNLRCSYCHDHELLDAPDKFPPIPVEAVLDSVRRNRSWVDGIVVTGGEPTAKSDLPALLQQFKQTGAKVKLDTNGTNPAMIDLLLREGLLDYLAMDIKALLNAKSYSKAAGTRVAIGDIEQSIDLLMNDSVPYEFRTTVVPGLIDLESVRAIARRISGARLFCLQQFVPTHARQAKLRNVAPYPPETLHEMAEAASALVTSVKVRGV